VHYRADLQSGHGLRCYGNITRTRNVSEYMLVLALCLVDSIVVVMNTINKRSVYLSVCILKLHTFSISVYWA